MSRARFEGVFAAIVTPFGVDGRVDEKALGQHVERLCRAGAHVVPLGTTGEAPTLTHEERNLVIRTATDIAHRHGRLSVAGCGSNATEIAAQYLKEAGEMGCDGALVVAPYYNKPTQTGLMAHYTTLAEVSPVPIVLYNVPGRTSVNIAVETTLQLLKLEKIAGIKESSGNHAHWLDLASRIDPNEVSFLAGDDDALATLLGLGASGIISTTANVAPEPFLEMVAAAKENDFRRVFATQTRILPLVRAMFAETNPAPVKAALAELGFMSDQVRLPLVTVSKSTREMISHALTQLERKT